MDQLCTIGKCRNFHPQCKIVNHQYVPVLKYSIKKVLAKKYLKIKGPYRLSSYLLTCILYGHLFCFKVKALQDAKASNPNGRWWIKADACDVREGLRESVRGKWSGDEDLGDGSVDRRNSEYTSKCNAVKKMCAQKQSSLSVDHVKILVDGFVDDTEFLKNGLATAKKKYESKLTNSCCSDDLLMKLSWDVVGFEQLLKQTNEFKDELNIVIDDLKLGLQNVGVVHLRELEKNMLQYYKDIYSKKRSSASHLLVFMLADELRNVKPYAVPVQFMPTKTITDDQMRKLELEISMKSYGMVPVGMSSTVDPIIDTCLLMPRDNERSRVHKTYCFPKVSINKCSVVYQVSNDTRFVALNLKISIKIKKNSKNWT